MPNRFRLYVVPFLAGSLLGGGLYFVLQSTDFLATNIAGTPITEETLSDVSVNYNEVESSLTIIANKDMPATDSITLLVNYDSETVTLETTDFQSIYPVYPSRIQDGQYMVTIQELGTITKNTQLLTITPKGDNNQITISDVVINFTDSTSARLAVGVPSF
ncbi:MAG: hypothetical protein Q8O99_08175 [bacterium]|nr:hypothetical protein [bacterium]